MLGGVTGGVLLVLLDTVNAVSVLTVAVHSFTMADGCLVRNDWVCGQYLDSRRAELVAALSQHLVITVVSVCLAVLVAAPLAWVAHRWRWSQGWLLGGSTIIYTVPSLALFSLLLPVTGLSIRTVVVGLVLYSLTILVRAFAAALSGVPAEVVDAAQGMGMSRWQLLRLVQVPLAIPAMMAGVRVAAVSTVSLTTVGAVVGYGGLGDLILQGLRSLFKAQVLTASVLCVALALTVDLALLVLQRALTPWRRGKSA